MTRRRPAALAMTRPPRHCEERSDEAIFPTKAPTKAPAKTPDQDDRLTD